MSENELGSFSVSIKKIAVESQKSSDFHTSLDSEAYLLETIL